MTKRVKNLGLSACKSPNGISVQTTEWGANVCISRSDTALTLTIYHDGNDTPMTIAIPLTDSPCIWPRDETAVTSHSINVAIDALVSSRIMQNL